MADVKELAAALVGRLGPVEAARRVRCSRQMISAVATGERQPGAKLAAAIVEAAAAVPPSPTPRSKRKPGATLDELQSTVDAIDATLAGDVPATAKAALFRARIDAIHRMSVLRGEHELTPQQLLRSKPWRDVMARIEPILERHPEVAAEIADALEALEGIA